MILRAPIPRLLFAWILAVEVFRESSQHFMVSRPMSCLPLESVSYPATSRLACSSMCLLFQGVAFRFAGGECEVRGAGKEERKDTCLFSIFSPPTTFKREEVSRGKPLEASPQYGMWKKDLATDSAQNTMYHSADSIMFPWWMLDMEEQRMVVAIDILTRQDSNWSRFHDIQIRVGATKSLNNDFSEWPLLAQYKGPYTLEEGVLSFSSESGICGRYVVIHKVSNDYDHLQLVDVKIYVKNP